jgi:hypothetical protein
MLKELLRGVDDKVTRLLYVCRRASLGTIVYMDSPESGATIETNSQPRPFPFFLTGNVPSGRLINWYMWLYASRVVDNYVEKDVRTSTGE